MDSYFALLSLSFVENYHISIFTTFEKLSMINRLSNPINRNRSAAKISKVMSSSPYTPEIFDPYVLLNSSRFSNANANNSNCNNLPNPFAFLNDHLGKSSEGGVPEMLLHLSPFR